MDQRITGKGLEQDNIDIDDIPHISQDGTDMAFAMITGLRLQKCWGYSPITTNMDTRIETEMYFNL